MLLRTLNTATLLFFLLSLMLFAGNCIAPRAAQAEEYIIPFAGKDLNGQPVDLRQTIGNKPVMLVFWASWCPNCVTEVPKVNQLAKKYQQRGMDFIAVNVGYNDSVERARAFAKEVAMNYPAVFDSSGMISSRYMIQGVPTVIIADKHGIVRFRNFIVPEIDEDAFSQFNAD